MNKFLLLSPILWLRKVLIYILVLFIALGILVYFVANSPWVITKAADMYAADYNISYSRIHGNVLTGIQIEDLAYNHEPLAKHVRVKWNPNGLIKKQIIVNNATFHEVNVDTIKALLASFSSDENTSSEPFAFSVRLDNLSIVLSSFVHDNINVKALTLEAKGILYTSAEIAIEKVALTLDSNITTVHLDANIHKGVVNVKLLEIDALDTLALQKLVVPDENASVNSPDNDVSSPMSTNTLIPKEIRLKTLILRIVPLTYDGVSIQSMVFGMHEAQFDISTLLLKQGDITLKTNTNLANIIHKGHIKNNQLKGTLHIVPKETLYTQYDLPLNPTAISELNIELDVSKERAIASIDTNISKILKAKKDAFNIDINNLKSTVTYTLEDATLNVESVADVSTPYAKNIRLHNFFTMGETIRYKGEVFVKQIIGVDAKFVQPLSDLTLRYSGDEKSINTTIDSAMSEGTFVSKNFKTASLHIVSKDALNLRDFVTLPSELNASKAKIVIDVPLDFENNVSYVATAKIQSNLANIDVNVTYNDTLHLTTMIDVHKKSLLRGYSDAVKWDAIMPAKINADLLETGVKIDIVAGTLKTHAQYDFNTSKVQGTVLLGSLKTDIVGFIEKEIKVESQITAIPLLMKSIAEVYTLKDVPKVDGSANITLLVNDLKKITLSMTSPKVLYYIDHQNTTDISNIDIRLHYEAGKLILERYKVTLGKDKVYATKPSTVTFNDNLITINPLWVNDQLKAEGNYDLNTSKGKVLVHADKFHLAHEIIDLDSTIDVIALLDGNKTDVKGKVVLLSGDIHYDLSKKSFASDSDILIIQDMKDEEPSTFMDNLSVELQVQTKKPLVYNKDAINIQAKVDLNVHKVEHADLLVLGSIELIKGGTYIFENKQFILDKSFVHFTGNPNKPLLDLKVNYKALEYVISIKITGSAELPHIAFSSKPSLNKEQILSLILFDTVEAAGTNSGDEMMKMMGGAMAKSALNNIGVKLDHLVLGEGNSIEVGKKITKKLTVIYVNGDVATVKLKYEHGKHTESVIGASEVSQSYDIVYKRDF